MKIRNAIFIIAAYAAFLWATAQNSPHPVTTAAANVPAAT